MVTEILTYIAPTSGVLIGYAYDRWREWRQMRAVRHLYAPPIANTHPPTCTGE